MAPPPPSFLAPTQKTNLALLVSAILKKRTLCLSELARAYPVPDERRVAVPKHCLLHRLKEALALHRRRAGGRPGSASGISCPTRSPDWAAPPLLGLAIDWTIFDATLPSGRRVRYQVLRVAVPRKGRALPLLQLAYDRDHLPPEKVVRTSPSRTRSWPWSRRFLRASARSSWRTAASAGPAS